MNLIVLLAPPGMVGDMFEQEQEEIMVGKILVSRAHVPECLRVRRQGWVRN